MPSMPFIAAQGAESRSKGTLSWRPAGPMQKWFGTNRNSQLVLQFYCALLFTEAWRGSLWFESQVPYASYALRPPQQDKGTPRCRVSPPGCGNWPRISPTCQLCIPNAACPRKLHSNWGGQSQIKISPALFLQCSQVHKISAWMELL